MPGDTLIITNAADSARIMDSLNNVYSGRVIQSGEGSDLFSAFVPFGILLLIIAAPFLIKWSKEKLRQKKVHQTLEFNFARHDEWLAAYNGYYKSLSTMLRQRFIERVALFMATKTFTCIDLPQEDKMPLLISAASVQITFGLDKYELDFFDTIYILQHNYKYGLYNMPFEGHVNSNGIYLSWDNFLRGYEDYTDADNVGIHEMAHALAYVNFMAGANDGQDHAFIQRFYHFSSIARPIFTEMQNGKTNLLNSYAATNYNEFWAVAVETFFEKSLHMKAFLPDLYEAMCSLLNQDPLLADKLLTIV